MKPFLTNGFRGPGVSLTWTPCKDIPDAYEASYEKYTVLVVHHSYLDDEYEPPCSIYFCKGTDVYTDIDAWTLAEAKFEARYIVEGMKKSIMLKSPIGYFEDGYFERN